MKMDSKNDPKAFSPCKIYHISFECLTCFAANIIEWT